MIGFILFSILAFVLVHSHEVSPSSYHDESLSLPNLLDKISKSQLSNWDFYNDFKLDTGRLLIEPPSKGSMWNKNPLSYNEWTIEYTLRSNGGSHFDNGVSFWLIDLDNSLPNSYDNLGGPVSYDGLQVVVNNKGGPGLRAYMNDGTKDFINDVQESFGNCIFSYQESQVPITVRISYKQNWFKIQIDNNLCLHTDKIRLPKNYNIGISAQSVHKEVFEILKVNVFGSVTEDAVDDHGIVNPQVTYKTVTRMENQQSQQTASPRESLIDKTRKQREAILHEAKDNKLADDKLGEILTKLDRIDSFDFKSLLHAIERQPSVSSNGELSYDSKVVESHLKELTKTVITNEKNIESLTQKLEMFQTKMDLQYSNLIKSLDELTKTTIREVREHQHVSEELSKKIDLLTLDHKESTYQKTVSSMDSFDKLESFLYKVKWILIPLLMLIVFLAYSVYRLRHDVKHSKLL